MMPNTYIEGEKNRTKMRRAEGVASLSYSTIDNATHCFFLWPHYSNYPYQTSPREQNLSHST